MKDKICGVYRITNSVSGKSYVGSSIHIEGRFRWHKAALRRGDHHAPMLQASWGKHGAVSFEFVVVEITTPEDRVVREQHWIDELHAFGYGRGYNAVPVAGTTANRVVSETTKAKLRAANLGKKASAETRAKMRAARFGQPSSMLGRTHTPETKAKMRALRLGKPRTAETCAKMSAANKGKPKSPEWRANLSASLKGRPISDSHREHLHRIRADYLASIAKQLP